MAKGTRKSGVTSPRVASQAGKDLRNSKTPKQDRAPIASALRQARPKAQKKTAAKAPKKTAAKTLKKTARVPVFTLPERSGDMAKKPEHSPFELPKKMGEFWRMYNPEKMQEIFNPQKFMEQVKAMTPGGTHLGDVVDQNRRNFEAMMEANKAAAETYRDMLEKQMEIFSRVTDTATEVRLRSGSGKQSRSR